MSPQVIQIYQTKQKIYLKDINDHFSESWYLFNAKFPSLNAPFNKSLCGIINLTALSIYRYDNVFLPLILRISVAWAMIEWNKSVNISFRTILVSLDIAKVFSLCNPVYTFLKYGFKFNLLNFGDLFIFLLLGSFSWDYSLSSGSF